MTPMRIKARVAAATALLSCHALAPAPGWATEGSQESPERPRVGLVLSGGGAKGGAHVGVLEVLEELRVPVDCIAGTSVGAVVGAGYASGLDAAQVREFILGIDWRTVVGGMGQRELQTIEQKRTGATYSNQLEFGLQHGRVILPGGLVATADIETLLRSYVARARMQSDFDRLPVPYRAVATDMLSGEMVVLDSGDIATAMRASMAIPGIFAPVITEDYVLADGGMVRNLPVDVARELCADVVIVVNLVEQPIPRERLQSARQLAARSMSVMLDANVAQQLQTLTERDVLIEVHVGDIDAASFDRIPDTMPLGAAAARAAAVRLADFAVPDAEYAAWRRRVSSPQDVAVMLAGVRYDGLERVNPAYLESLARIRPGDRVDVAAISEEARRMSALREFESVEYELEGDPDHPVLVWLPREKPWGPNYLSFDIGMYGAAGGSLAFVASAKHTRTWLNSRGAEWRNEAQFGYETILGTSLYQPIDAAHRYFVEPALRYQRNLEDVYIDGDRVATYRFADVAARLDAGVNLGHRAQVRVGFLVADSSASVDTGSPELPETDARDAMLALDLTYDSRDAPANPSRGMGAIFEYREARDILGGEREWRRAELGVGTAVQLGNDVFWLTLAGGTDFNSGLPPDRAFALGGPASFPGFHLGELRGAEYWTVGGSYLWKVRDIYALRGHALYGGVRVQAGRVHDTFDLFDDQNIVGASVYLTGRTLVGPLTVGIGRTTTDAWSLWLGIGRPIGHGTVLERGILR